jgi:naphtho-gamma-pyrone polyketide synthase
MQSKSTPAAKTASNQNTAVSHIPTPTKSIVSRVMEIMSEEAGLDLADLTEDSEFAEYGIDSLLSLTISSRLREELELDLELTLFADYPTVGELTSFLSGSQGCPPSPTFLSGDERGTSSEQITPATSEGYETGSTIYTETKDVTSVTRATTAERTGAALKGVTHSGNFSDLGVDSLLTLANICKLGGALGIELPHVIFDNGDILGEVENSLSKPKVPGSNNGYSTAAQEVTRHKSDRPPHATSVLLQGNPKTAKKILFLFPDGSGSATSYASLPKISPDIVVYGLNCPWMKTPQDMKCSLEELTAKYLVDIRKRQPMGPYYFGGWSAGGICAYEAAQQLARSGEEVARLILIDSPNPVGLENPPQRMYDFFESLDFLGMNGKAPPSWLRPHFNAFLSSLDRYEVKPFDGLRLETHIIYARDGICKLPSDPRPEIRPDDPREMLWLLNNRTDFSGKGWDELVGPQNLKIKVIDDVNHFSMVAPGLKIHELSSFIRRAME